MMKNLSRETIDAARQLKRNIENLSQAHERNSSASREFGRRYGRWCLEASTAEWASGFRFVQLVQDNASGIFLDFIEPLTPSEKKEAIIALSKGMHCPEMMSDTEKEICERYREHWSMPYRVGQQLVSALRTTPHQLELQEEFFRQCPRNRTIAQLLRKALKDTRFADLGSLLQDKPSILAYEKSVGPWHVVTSFELLGRSQLRYAHHIHALSGGKRETRIYSGISVLHWTGIHADSSWSWLLPEDIPRIAKAVHQICLYFIKHSKHLLRGLSSDIR
jgi:hypothetical protein